MLIANMYLYNRLSYIPTCLNNFDILNYKSFISTNLYGMIILD